MSEKKSSCISAHQSNTLNLLKVFTLIFTFGLCMFGSNNASAATDPNAPTPCIPVYCTPCDCSGFGRFVNGQCVCYSQGNMKVYGHVSMQPPAIVIGNPLGKINPNASQANINTAPQRTISDYRVDYEHVKEARKVKTNVYVGNPKTPGYGTVYANVYTTGDTADFTMLIITDAPDFKTYQTSANLGEEISTKTENEEAVLETLEQFSDISKYVDNMVMVYPNPTNSVAFAKVSQDFINSYKVVSINYELFNAEQKPITKFTVSDNANAHIHSEQCRHHKIHSNNVLDAITISAEQIAQAGAYYLKCDIIFIDNGSERTQTIVVPFMVNK